MKKLIILLMLLTFIISCSENSTEPETKLKIMISPEVQNISVNSFASCELLIENAVDLFAFSGEIHFDSTYVELLPDQISAGTFWDTDPLLETIDETNCLNVCIGLTQTNSTDAISGSGILLNFSLKGINLGQSDIYLSNIQLIDENGSLIDNFSEIEIGNSIIYVEN